MKLPSSIFLYLLLSSAVFCSSCTPTPENVQQSSELPPLYPDYCDVTIPENIAPLNFLLRADCEAIEVKAGTFVLNAKGEPCFNFGKHKGKTVTEVFEKEPNYYAWIMDGQFAQSTKHFVTKIKLQMGSHK